MRPLILLILIALVPALFAQDEAWQDKQDHENQEWHEKNQQEKAAWDQQAALERARWQDGVQRESAAWQAHIAAVKQKWKDARFSGVKQWVGYGTDNDTRFVADFENGTLELDVLGSRYDNSSMMQQHAVDLLNQLLREKSDLDREPLLKNQLDINERNIELPGNAFDIKSYLAPDGQRYNRLSIRIPFKENHLRARAQRIIPHVQKYAEKYSINEKLIMAVIHTESAFNPRAVSTFKKPDGSFGHAYGLMQLVPSSGGKEAYELIGGQGEPSPQYLFHPERNIELGVVYLNKLSEVYFSAVDNQLSRQILMSASYNTGPQNVAQAMVGREDLAAAIQRVNTMTARELYMHLRYNLPYEETRNYIVKVNDRILQY